MPDEHPDSAEVSALLEQVSTLHEIEQQVQRYRHMAALTEEVISRYSDVTNEFVDMSGTNEAVFDDLRVRIDAAAYGEHALQLNRSLVDLDSLRAQWRTADLDALLAAYDSYEPDAVTALPQQPEPDAVVEPESLDAPRDAESEPLGIAGRVASNFVERVKLADELETRWGTLEQLAAAGEQVAAERPDWSAHLGPMPAGAVSSFGWVETAGEVATWREQFGITDPTTLVGDEPPHGCSVEDWQRLNDRAAELRSTAATPPDRRAEPRHPDGDAHQRAVEQARRRTIHRMSDDHWQRPEHER